MDDFEAAATTVRNFKTKPPEDVFGQFYGLYKQATAGDVNTAKPADALGISKYDAWSKQKGKSKDQAKTEYIKLANDLKSKYA